jgi:hypothetical protein
VLATNALVSALVFPLLYVLLTRVFRVPRPSAVAAAFLAALYPPLVVTTQFAWAESLLAVLGLVQLARALSAGLAAVVGWFLLPPWRPDHIVYGRYVEILVPPLLALGLVRLWTAAARRVALELAGGTAAALVAGLAAT